MEKVTGIGGVFFKANRPKELKAWYQENLGIEIAEWGGHEFKWRDAADPASPGGTTWGVFPKNTKYFDPSSAAFMINYRVRDLKAMLEQLRKAGAQVDDKIQEEENGKFGWAIDPEGTRMELWEPAPGH